MKHMGVNDLFSESCTALSGASDIGQLFVSSMQHKTIYKVSNLTYD